MSKPKVKVTFDSKGWEYADWPEKLAKAIKSKLIMVEVEVNPRSLEYATRKIVNEAVRAFLSDLWIHIKGDRIEIWENADANKPAMRQVRATSRSRAPRAQATGGRA